jgi:hypothetical protein
MAGDRRLVTWETSILCAEFYHQKMMLFRAENEALPHLAFRFSL